MDQERKIINRLRRLVHDARAAGIALIADAQGTGAIRVTSVATLREADDLRQVGQAVEVDGACGGGVLPRIDGSGNG